MTDDLNLLNAKQTAAVLKISTRTLWRMLAKGEGPVGGPVNGRLRWMQKDVTAWWEENKAKENRKLNPALR